MIPYWRLSGFYFLYYAVVGSIIPFWGLYLHQQGYSAEVIGYVSAVMMATRIVAPNVWGFLADRTGRRLLIIRLGSFAACLCFLLVFNQHNAGLLLLSIGTYSFFWSAILAQFEVVTLNYLGSNAHRYSRIRLWGSIGFIVSVVGLGWVFEFFDIRFLPYYILFLLGLIGLCSLSIKEQSVSENHESGDAFFGILKQPVVIFFCIASFFLHLSHGAYYTFYTLYLERLDYSRPVIGALWACGVIVEIIIFLFVPRLLQFFTLRSLLLWSLILAALRWWLIAEFAETVSLLIFAQLLHAFTFGAAHAVGIEIIRQFFPGRHQGQGQALYSALSFGAGGAIGASVSGMLWDLNPSLCFLVSAAAAFAAFLVAWYGVKFKASPA